MLTLMAADCVGLHTNTLTENLVLHTSRQSKECPARPTSIIIT
jgi:hypothetical protein